MWEKIKVACMRSLTIAWGYVMALASALLSAVDLVGQALGDPTLKDQISAAIGDPATAARILAVCSIITILARLRGLAKGA